MPPSNQVRSADSIDSQPAGGASSPRRVVLTPTGPAAHDGMNIGGPFGPTPAQPLLADATPSSAPGTPLASRRQSWHGNLASRTSACTRSCGGGGGGATHQAGPDIVEAFRFRGGSWEGVTGLSASSDHASGSALHTRRTGPATSRAGGTLHSRFPGPRPGRAHSIVSEPASLRQLLCSSLLSAAIIASICSEKNLAVHL